MGTSCTKNPLPPSAISVSSTHATPFAQPGHTSLLPPLPRCCKSLPPPSGATGVPLQLKHSSAPPSVDASPSLEPTGKPRSVKACMVQPPPLPRALPAGCTTPGSLCPRRAPSHRRLTRRGDCAGRGRECATRECAWQLVRILVKPNNPF
jgi:hypothetical protein